MALAAISSISLMAQVRPEGLGHGGNQGNQLTFDQATKVCLDEVRGRALRDLNYRQIEFAHLRADDRPDHHDWIAGDFKAVGGSALYRFACKVDFSAGTVRSVEMNRQDGAQVVNRLTYDQATKVCLDEIRRRALNDHHYSDIQFAHVRADDRPGHNDWIAGEFKATGGSDEYRFGCNVDFSAGTLRSVEIRRKER
jgi:hypothetical protein